MVAPEVSVGLDVIPVASGPDVGSSAGAGVASTFEVVGTVLCTDIEISAGVCVD